MTVYRSPQGDAARRRAAPEAPEVIDRLDASGRRGADGSDGARGQSGIHSGEDGRSGGDAGPAQRGQDAGWFDVRLAPVDEAGAAARLTGRGATPDGQAHEIDRELAIGDSGFIDLITRGGDGGVGGSGGMGGNGARGRDGSDATRYSRGTDGGSGGGGGDGGDGSSGADGGRGGHVKVTVDARDTHLLMLVRHDVGGGKGGAAGSNGQGGCGGAGGRGGSSYSWSEEESYTDSQGNRHTRTTWHSNSGGSDGSTGRGGRPGSARLHPGSDGAAGTFAIAVEEGGRTATYPSRYELQLTGVQHESDNQDGISEPGEEIHVSRVEVQNAGGMPTPAHREVVITLVDRDWVVPEAEQRLVLPRSLAPGERHVFETEALTFTLGQYHPQAASDPLREEARFHLRAFLPAVRRGFDHFEESLPAGASSLLVQFPVQISPIQTLHALAPGEAARVRWTVTSISKKAFGARSALRRGVAVRLRLHDSDLGPDEVHCFDESGRRVPLDQGYARPIDVLDAGASLSFEVTLAIDPGAAPYRSAGLRLELHLGEIGAPEKLRPIQYRDFTVRVAERFDAQPDADLLLVVGNRTTQEELGAWRALAAAAGCRAAVWDLSREGAPGVEVLARFEGRTVVVLNASMDTVLGDRSPRHHIDKHELLRAAAAGTRFAFVGRRVELGKLLVPTPASDGGASAALVPAGEGAPADKAWLAEEGEGSARLRQEAARACARVEVHERFWLWGKPREDALAKRALAVQRALEAELPERRYVVVHDFAPERRPGSWPRQYLAGSLEIRRTLDTAAAAVLFAPADDAALHRPEFVLSRDNVAFLLAALPFEAKLARLGVLLAGAPLLPGGGTTAAAAASSGAVPSREALLELLIGAVLLDLAHEQAALVRQRWCFRRDLADVSAKLPRLARLARADWLRAPLSPDTGEGRAFLRLAAWLRFLAEDHGHWLAFLPPLLFVRRGPKVRRAAGRLIDELVRRAFAGEPPHDEPARVRWKQARAAIRKLVAEFDRDREQSLGRAGRAVGHCLSALGLPDDGRGAITDADQLHHAEDRVLTRAEHTAIVKDDERRVQRRAKLMEAGAAARAALLLPEGCEALLARASGRRGVIQDRP